MALTRVFTKIVNVQKCRDLTDLEIRVRSHSS